MGLEVEERKNILNSHCMSVTYSSKICCFHYYYNTEWKLISQITYFEIG